MHLNEILRNTPLFKVLNYLLVPASVVICYKKREMRGEKGPYTNKQATVFGQTLCDKQKIGPYDLTGQDPITNPNALLPLKYLDIVMLFQTECIFFASV